MRQAGIWGFAAVAFAAAAWFFLADSNEPPRIANAPPGKGAIVAFGDSLTAGHGAPSEKSYPAQLSERIGRPVLNQGRNGDTTQTALERLKKDVLAHDPALVLITLGGNDLQHRTPLSQTLDRLETIFRKLQDQKAMVVFLGIEPPMIGDNWALAIQDLCRRRNVLWVDQVMEGLWGDAEKMSDSIHPNEEGYSVMARRVHEALTPYL